MGVYLGNRPVLAEIFEWGNRAILRQFPSSSSRALTYSLTPETVHRGATARPSDSTTMATRPSRDISTDVLIVGSGPIGCTYARCLIQAGRQVLMVEAGSQHSKRPGEHLKNAFVYQRDVDRFSPIVLGLLHPISVPTGAAWGGGALDPVAFRVSDGIRSAQNPQQDPRKNLPAAAVAYGVGGMFTHWTSNTPRYHPTLERVGWIGPEEWDQLYAVAERLCNTHTDVFDRSIRHRLVTERLRGHLADRCKPPYDVQALPVAGERRKDNDEFVHFSGADTILGPLIDEPDRFAPDAFSILPEHRGTELVRKGDRIDHVVVEDLIHWETVRVRADVVVVAAGSILTPQILWNSGIRPRPLGRYLTEHPMTFCQIVMDAELVDGARNILESATRVATTPSEDPVPIPMNDPPPMVWIPVSEERRWHSQVHRDSFQYGQLPPDVDDRVVVDLRWFGMVDPVEENLVTFSDSAKDKFGMPKPQFEFSLGADDGRRTHKMMSDMVDCAQALGGFLPGSEPRFLPLGSSLHFLGTTRMGERDDGTSVVDPWCRFWGLENLYLGGNGVTPTSTASNPTLTSIAMAVRSASSITGLPPSGLAPE
jgi:pyranose oxidase